MSRRRIYKRGCILIVMFFTLISFNTIFAQLTFNGPSTVRVGEIAFYYLKDPTVGYDNTGSKYSGFYWVTTGLMMGPDGYNQTYIKWTSEEDQSVYVICHDNFFNFYHEGTEVTVLPQYSAPIAPTVLSSDCSEVVLQRKDPPAGVIWYWQSSDGGTSTANSDPTITLTSGSEYFLTAKYLDIDEWYPYSSKVEYTIGIPAPIVGAITQPSINTPTGSAVLSGLPSTGTWIINPGNISGTGTTKTITGLAAAATYNFTVTDASNCTSSASTAVVINPQIAPTLSSVTQPTCLTNKGSFTITNYNASYNYSAIPSNGVIFSGASVTAPVGNYTIKSTFGGGSSYPSENVTVNEPPAPPAAPTVGTITQPTATTLTASVVLSGLPSTGTWVINPGNISGTGTTKTVTGLTAPAAYNFTVTNASGCTSLPSLDVIVNRYCGLSNENYVYSIVPQVETTTVSSLQNTEKQETITYFDGLGRPKQTLAIRAGMKNDSTTVDIITPIGYDNFGRQTKEYLPYADDFSCLTYRSGNIDILTKNFYNTSKYENTQTPYSEKEFEASPLNRVLKQAAPGNDWMMKSVGIECASCIDGNTADFYTNTCDEYRYYLLNMSINLDYYDPLNTSAYNSPEGIAYRNNNPLPPMNGINSGPDKTIKFEYGLNEIDEVRLFKVNLNIVNNVYFPTLTGGDIYYGLGQLDKVVTKDENWWPTQQNLKDHTTEEFKDKDGRVVLKRTYDNNLAHDTYYVYDDYGNLTFVLPPKVNTTDGVSAEELEELCYQYTYDQKNRLVEKKLPGKGIEYIVYDKLDRPVLTQDANLRTQNKWLFTKYDVLGRPVYTGDYKNSVTTTRADVQGLVDATTYLFESRTAANTINTTTVYYTNVAFPAINDTNINVFTINYYDDYGFDIDGGVSEPVGTNPQITPSTATKGLATGSKIRVLGENSWITNVIYYDAKARPIYNYSKNNYLGTIAKVKTELDFVGKPTKTTTTHQRNNVTTTVVDSLTYDPQGRLLTQRQKINTQPEELIVSNEYDELGQLKGKGVGGKATATSPLQTVDYTYNIRGWLKGINDGDNDNSTITLGSGDLFGFQINYNNPTDASKALYNGNISQTFWKTANTDTSLKNYTYTYDALNRLINAKYSLEDRYNETLSYDKNGNIMSLIRTGNTDVNSSTAFGVIDNLTYSYGPSNLHNRLTRVSDTQSNIAGLADEFKDNGLNSDDYGYDINGNMTRDDNKGISIITYNHLNLPTSVTMGGGTINYTYDATGVKQRKIVSTGITTDYAGGFQYEKNNNDNNPPVLKFFPTTEGYAEYNATNGIFSYIYQYKDHLGNVRLSYKDVSTTTTPSLQIVEESNYYPFGLKQKVFGEPVINSSYKYKYNGKELQDELGLNMYDYGARNYDPALGRWMNIDPLAETSRRFSPYTYALNNPVYFIDPDGKQTFKHGEPGFAEAWRDLQNQAKTWKGKDNIGEDEEEGHEKASSSEWYPLTADIFNSYVQKKYGISDKQIGDFAGKLFENAFVKFGEVNFEADANFEGVPGRSTLSRPDAYSDGLHLNWRLNFVRYSKSVWWEVKARNKNVTLDKQIKGFIDGIYEKFKYSATKTGAAYLCLVTTSNSNVNLEVYSYAQSKGVQINHWVAQYRMNGGNMEIDFGYSTGPLNPTIYEFKTPVKL